MAASKAAQEAAYLMNLLAELDFPTGTVPLSVDNTGAIDLSYNPEHHARTKHIGRRHYFVRDMVTWLSPT